MAEAKSTQDKATKPSPSGVQLKPRKIGLVKRRKIFAVLSFVFMVVLPSLLGAAYYGFVATDRYAAGAGFVVRSLEEGGSTDIFSAMTGLSTGGSTTADSYIIRGFIESADLLRELDNQLAIQSHFSNTSIDYLSRYTPDQPFEEFVKYWRWRSDTNFDSSTGIVTFEVQAFDPQMTLDLANAVLDATVRLVNQISESARRDAVAFATIEVDRAEERLRTAQAAVREFRSTSGSVDPAASAQLDAELSAQLEAQLAEVRSRIAVLANQLSDDAPTMRQLRAQATALVEQIAERRAAVGAEAAALVGATTAEELARYEALLLELTFAQQRYASSLTSLEVARMNADRQQRYLAIYTRPELPELAIYPYRLRNALVISAAAFLLWSIGSLIVTAVRDHMR